MPLTHADYLTGGDGQINNVLSEYEPETRQHLTTTQLVPPPKP